MRPQHTPYTSMTEHDIGLMSEPHTGAASDATPDGPRDMAPRSTDDLNRPNLIENSDGKCGCCYLCKTRKGMKELRTAFG